MNNKKKQPLKHFAMSETLNKYLEKEEELATMFQKLRIKMWSTKQ